MEKTITSMDSIPYPSDCVSQKDVKCRWGETGKLREMEWPKAYPGYLSTELVERVKDTALRVNGEDFFRIMRVRQILESVLRDPVIYQVNETGQRDALFTSLVGGASTAYFRLLTEYSDASEDDGWWLHYQFFAALLWWNGRTSGSGVETLAGVHEKKFVVYTDKLSADVLTKREELLAQNYVDWQGFLDLYYPQCGQNRRQMVEGE